MGIGLGLRVILATIYLSTRESGESGVCPSGVGLWETSIYESFLKAVVRYRMLCSVAVVGGADSTGGEGCLFICWMASSP